MSINSLTDLYYHSNQNTVQCMTWMMSKIDYSKLLSRVTYAHLNPEKRTKCVLLEYNHTTRLNSKSGIPYIIEYLPGTDVPLHHVIQSPDFIRCVDSVFGNENSKVKIYSRQKIKNDGTPDFNKRQLVAVFEPWAFVDAPLPPSMESSIMYESDDE
jgi:hypothetical protein